MEFITAAYCTKGGYEEASLALRDSLRRLNMPHQVRVIHSMGSWQKNCLYKPRFIKEMLETHKKPVLYLDADAVVHKYPNLFDSLEADIAVHYFRNKQLASGTLFFMPSAPALRVLNAWINKNKADPKAEDQLNLQRVLECPGIRAGLRIYYLPAEYCKIFDLAPDVQEPVIEHYQASRRLRIEENITPFEKDKYKRQWQSGYQASQCAIYLAQYVASVAPVNYSFLEVGCGNGRTARELCGRGQRCTGVDITLAGIQGDKTGFIEAPVWRMPFKDNEFDFIFSSDVFEHVPSSLVEASIKECFRVTKHRMFHCIATFPDSRNGVELHLTVKPITWWKGMFDKHNTKGLELEIIDRKEFLDKVGYGSRG